MARKTIKFEGVAKLQKAIAKNVKMDDVKRIIAQNGSELQQKAQGNADFKGHYRGNTFVPPTGNLKEKIMLELTDGGMAAEVEPKAEYSAYVELGTRFMTAQPYLKPAWEAQMQQFKKDMDRLVK